MPGQAFGTIVGSALIEWLDQVLTLLVNRFDIMVCSACDTTVGSSFDQMVEWFALYM